MSRSGFGWSSLPSRRVIVGSLLAALAGGSLLGLVLGILAPVGGVATPDTTVASTPATTPTGIPVRTPTPSASASARSSASPSIAVKTVILQPAPVPSDVITDPAADHTLMLGILESIDHTDPNNIILSVTRADLLTGARARAFDQQQGQQPQDTAVATVDGAQPQQYQLEGDAALWGTFVIGDGQHANPQRFALQDFLDTTDGVFGQNQHPAVWIKRSLDVAGPVIYLAEQYPA